jgi:hypothetical protein
MKINQTLLVVSLMFLAAIGTSRGAERFPWLTDLGAARELAAREHKPLLIVFRCEP